MIILIILYSHRYFSTPCYDAIHFFFSEKYFLLALYFVSDSFVLSCVRMSLRVSLESNVVSFVSYWRGTLPAFLFTLVSSFNERSKYVSKSRIIVNDSFAIISTFLQKRKFNSLPVLTQSGLVSWLTTHIPSMTTQSARTIPTSRFILQKRNTSDTSLCFALIIFLLLS